MVRARNSAPVFGAGAVPAGRFPVQENAPRAARSPAFAPLLALAFFCFFFLPGALAVVPAGAAELNFQKPPVDVSGFQDNLGLGERPAADRPRAQAKSGGSSSSKVVFRKDRLFGTVEFRSKLKIMPKWQRVMNAYKGKSGIDAAFQVSNRKREA